MVVLDVDSCGANAVGVTLRVSHSVDGFHNLVQAVDEVAYATVGILVGMNVVQVLRLIEQLVDVAVRRWLLTFTLNDLAERLFEKRPRFGKRAVVFPLGHISLCSFGYVFLVLAIDSLNRWSLHSRRVIYGDNRIGISQSSQLMATEQQLAVDCAYCSGDNRLMPSVDFFRSEALEVFVEPAQVEKYANIFGICWVSKQCPMSLSTYIQRLDESYALGKPKRLSVSTSMGPD